MVKEVVKNCIDELSEYWVKVRKRDAKERTVVQIVDGSSFACVKPVVLEKWFDQLKEKGLLSGRQHHELTNCLNPKTLISQIISNMGSMNYIQVLQILEKAGGEKVAHKLGQEAYLQSEKPPQPPPPLPAPESKLGTFANSGGLFHGAVAPGEKSNLFGPPQTKTLGGCRKIEFPSEYSEKATVEGGFSFGGWPEKRKSPERQVGDKKCKTDELINQAGQLMKQLYCLKL